MPKNKHESKKVQRARAKRKSDPSRVTRAPQQRGSVMAKVNAEAREHTYSPVETAKRVKTFRNNVFANLLPSQDLKVIKVIPLSKVELTKKACKAINSELSAIWL